MVLRSTSVCVFSLCVSVFCLCFRSVFSLCGSGSETPERQQDSSPCQAKRTPKECFTLPLEPLKNNALVRFRNTRTPAGFEPMPSKTHAQRMLHVIPLEPIKNNALVRFRNTRMPAGYEPMPSKTHAERVLHVTFGTLKKQCFGPVPKHPNASRI